MRFLVLVSIAVTAIAVGCTAQDNRSLTGLTVQEAATRQGAAAYILDQCPVNPTVKTEAIFSLAAGALVPLLANFAVEIGSNLLESAKEGLTGQFVAGAASTGLYSLNQSVARLSFSCIVIVRGLFGATQVEGGAGAGDGRMDATQLKELGLADYPAFYLELEATLEGRSLVLQPRYVRYAQSKARLEGSGKKHVGVVLALSEAVLAPDDAPTDDKTIALYRFDLGRLEIGRSYTHDESDRPLLKGTAAQQVVPAAGGNQGLVPFNLTAIVTETEEPSLLLEALSESYKTKKGDLEKSLSEILTSAVGQK